MSFRSQLKKYIVSLPYYHLDYCVTVWGTSDDARLDKLQKQETRIILDYHYLTPSKEMFSKLRWLPLKDWVKYRKATMTYKVNQWQSTVL